MSLKTLGGAEANASGLCREQAASRPDLFIFSYVNTSHVNWSFPVEVGPSVVERINTGI